MAGVFSGLGFFATKTWYESVKSQDTSTAAQSIAKIIETRNDVQRKRFQRTIWQGVDNQIELSNGDAVRTGPDGGARIEFVNSKTVIELDPDSLIIVEEKQGKVALDFLKGNLFVKQGAEGDQSLTVLSGKKEIDLSRGETAVGLSETGSLVTTNLSNSGPVVSGGFQILSPLPFAKTYVDPQSPKQTIFSWTPFNKPHEVKLLLGRSPTTLEEASIVTSPKNPGKLASLLKVGFHYWRLVAYEKDAQGVLAKKPFATSNVMSLELRPRTAPIGLYPLAKAHIRLKEGAATPVTFRWSNPAQLSNVKLELAQINGASKQVVHSVSLSGRETQYIYDVSASGDYEWRVSGVGANAQIDLPGTFTSFNASTATDLSPPVLLKPANNERLPTETVRASGLFLVWKPVQDAVGYKVTIKSSKGNFTRDSQANSLNVTDFGRGEIAWSVVAVAEDKSLSKASDTWRFRVDEVRAIEWTNITQPDVFWYVGQSPQADLFWSTKNLDEVKSWRLRWARVGELLSERPWISVSSGKTSQAFPKDDDYTVELEGLNAAGIPIAKSSRRTLEVKLLPTPTAPIFAGENPASPIQARGSGDADFAWKPVERAVSYAIRLTSATGREQEFETAQTKSRLDQLNPGNYTLVLFAKDSYGRRSPASLQRAVTVPPFNDRRAPKLKSVKLKN